MALLKRKRIELDEDEESSSHASLGGGSSDDDIDIAGALSGKKERKLKGDDYGSGSDDDDDFEELEALIKNSVSRRDKREGTKLLKKTKGKSKISKGEVGGGSFQSMGM